MQDVELNWVAVIVAAVVPMVVGALWYSPMVLGRPWLRGVGKTEADVRAASTAPYYAVAAAASFVMSYTLARVIRWADVDDLVNGAIIGVLAWFGFVATTLAVNYAFAGRPRNLYAIDAGYYLVSLLVMGAILGAWD